MGSINIRSVDNSLLDPSAYTETYGVTEAIENQKLERKSREEELFVSRLESREIVDDFEKVSSERQFVYKTEEVNQITSSRSSRKQTPRKKVSRNMNNRHAVLRHQLSLPQDQIYMNSGPFIRDVHLGGKKSYEY